MESKNRVLQDRKHLAFHDELGGVASRPVVTSNIVIRQGNAGRAVMPPSDNAEHAFQEEINADHVNGSEENVQHSQRITTSAVIPPNDNAEHAVQQVINAGDVIVPDENSEQQLRQETNVVRRIKLKKYDTFNNQVINFSMFLI